MNKARIISVIAGSAILLSSASTLTAFADNDNDNKAKGLNTATSQLEKKVEKLVGMDDKVNEVADRAESVNIKPNGDFKLTGVKVVGVSGNSITGSLYGLSLTVDIGSAKINGSNSTIALGDIKAGDVLVVWGTLNLTTKAATITKIHDISVRNRSELERIQARINELLEMLRKLQEKLKGAL